LQFQALSSRPFQRGFHRVNLHRPTTCWIVALRVPSMRLVSLEQGLTLVHFSA